jgi:rhodanese-related sulfurtransferase
VSIEPPAPEVSTGDLAGAMTQGATAVDVRELHEYNDAHIPGVQHIPLSELLERTGEIENRGTVYVVCAVGGRSLLAAGALRQLGYEAVSVAGGTNLWISEGRDVER